MSLLNNLKSSYRENLSNQIMKAWNGSLKAWKSEKQGKIWLVRSLEACQGLVSHEQLRFALVWVLLDDAVQRKLSFSNQIMRDRTNEKQGFTQNRLYENRNKPVMIDRNVCKDLWLEYGVIRRTKNPDWLIDWWIDCNEWSLYK